MTKLEEAEKLIRKPGLRGRWLGPALAQAIADSLDRTRELLEQQNRLALTYLEERNAARAELAALKGEAERTVYVVAQDEIDANERALRGCSHGSIDRASARTSFWLAGDSVFAVRLSARKVSP